MNYHLTTPLCVFVYITVWFIVSVLKKRNDVADIAWGFGFVVLAWISKGVTTLLQIDLRY